MKKLPTALFVLIVATSIFSSATGPEKATVPNANSIVAPSAKPQLSIVGKGIRKKKVFLFTVQVYEAELLVSKPKEFLEAAQANALDALGKMDAASIRLKLLRTVGSDKMRESFSDALKANHIDPNSGKMADFIKKISETPSFDEGKKVSITADLSKGTIAYESPDGKTSEMQADRKDILNLFSIWLGTPADSGLANLKDALTGKTK